MPSRYITFVSDEQFYRFESLAEALEWKRQFGGTVYEPLGMTTAEKVAAEPLTEQQETTAAYVASPNPWVHFQGHGEKETACGHTQVRSSTELCYVTCPVCLEKCHERTRPKQLRSASEVPPGGYLPKRHAVSIGDLIDRLVICNQKLWDVCEKKARLTVYRDRLLTAYSNSDRDQQLSNNAAAMAKVLADDISLCKERAALKGAISARLGEDGSDPKNYGGA